MIPQYNLPPINPAAFGGLPQGQGGAPATVPIASGAPQGQPPVDMNKYLINKVMEIRQRMGGGQNMGALGALANATPAPQTRQPQPPMRAMT